MTQAMVSASDVMHIDDCDLDEALTIVSTFGSARYGYVVTANVDHAIRHYCEAQFRTIYANAAYVLLDSRFLVRVLRVLKRQRLRASPGSDLTKALFVHMIKPRDVTVVVGGTAHQAQELRARFGLKALHHIDPPMNFIRDAGAVENCLREIEARSPFRFCFLAIGSPQQEIIAHKLQERGTARGLALCIGASINYITGAERRAPHWVQQIGLEWLFRLIQHPRRLAHRYLLRGPRIFWLAWHIQLRLRRPKVVLGEHIALSGEHPKTEVTGDELNAPGVIRVT